MERGVKKSHVNRTGRQQKRRWDRSSLRTGMAMQVADVVVGPDANTLFGMRDQGGPEWKVGQGRC